MSTTPAVPVLTRQDVEAVTVRSAAVTASNHNANNDHGLEQPVITGAPVAVAFHSSAGEQQQQQQQQQDVVDGAPEGITAYFRDVVDATGVTPILSENEEEEWHQQRQRRWFGGGAVVCLIAALLIVVIPLTTIDRGPATLVVLTGAPTMMPSAVPSTAPTIEPVSDALAGTMDLVRGYEATANLVSAEEDWWTNRSSPQYRACQWIARTENATTTPNDARLIQRYSLATFYWATSSSGDSDGEEQDEIDPTGLHRGWTECHHDAPQGCPGIEWLSVEDECDWGFLTCENGTVQTLNFPTRGNNLGGTLPPQLSLLSELFVFSIPNNQVAGGKNELPIGNTNSSAPPSPMHSFDQAVYGLSSLQVVNLHGNHFTDNVPTLFWGTNPLLQKVFLGDNQFTGTVPEEIAEAPRLEEVQVDGNLLTGTVVTAICNLSALAVLSVDCSVECSCCSTDC